MPAFVNLYCLLFHIVTIHLMLFTQVLDSGMLSFFSFRSIYSVARYQHVPWQCVSRRRSDLHACTWRRSVCVLKEHNAPVSSSSSSTILRRYKNSVLIERSFDTCTPSDCVQLSVHMYMYITVCFQFILFQRFSTKSCTHSKMCMCVWVYVHSVCSQY